MRGGVLDEGGRAHRANELLHFITGTLRRKSRRRKVYGMPGSDRRVRMGWASPFLMLMGCEIVRSRMNQRHHSGCCGGCVSQHRRMPRFLAVRLSSGQRFCARECGLICSDHILKQVDGGDRPAGQRGQFKIANHKEVCDIDRPLTAINHPAMGFLQDGDATPDAASEQAARTALIGSSLASRPV